MSPCRLRFSGVGRGVLKGAAVAAEEASAVSEGEAVAAEGAAAAAEGAF